MLCHRAPPENAWPGENNPIAKRKNIFSKIPQLKYFDFLHGKLMIDMYFFEFWAIQLRITGPKEMQSPERLYKYAIYNGEQVLFSI